MDVLAVHVPITTTAKQLCRSLHTASLGWFLRDVGVPQDFSPPAEVSHFSTLEFEFWRGKHALLTSHAPT